MTRFFTAVAALVMLVMTAGATLVALAYAEAGGIQQTVFDAEYGNCGDGIALPQVVVAALSFLTAGSGTVRLVRRGRPWPLLGLALLLVAGWVALVIVAGCGLGSDDDG